MSKITQTKFYRSHDVIDKKLVKRESLLAPTERKFFSVHPALKPVLLAPNQSINIKKEARRQGFSEQKIKMLGIK